MKIVARDRRRRERGIVRVRREGFVQRARGAGQLVHLIGERMGRLRLTSGTQIGAHALQGVAPRVDRARQELAGHARHARRAVPRQAHDAIERRRVAEDRARREEAADLDIRVLSRLEAPEQLGDGAVVVGDRRVALLRRADARAGGIPRGRPGHGLDDPFAVAATEAAAALEQLAEALTEDRVLRSIDEELGPAAHLHLGEDRARGGGAEGVARANDEGELIAVDRIGELDLEHRDGGAILRREHRNHGGDARGAGHASLAAEPSAPRQEPRQRA